MSSRRGTRLHVSWRQYFHDWPFRKCRFPNPHTQRCFSLTLSLRDRHTPQTYYHSRYMISAISSLEWWQMFPSVPKTGDIDYTHRYRFYDYRRHLSSKERKAQKRRYSPESYSNVKTCRDPSRRRIPKIRAMAYGGGSPLLEIRRLYLRTSQPELWHRLLLRLLVRMNRDTRHPMRAFDQVVPLVVHLILNSLHTRSVTLKMLSRCLTHQSALTGKTHRQPSL